MGRTHPYGQHHGAVEDPCMVDVRWGTPDKTFSTPEAVQLKSLSHSRSGYFSPSANVVFALVVAQLIDHRWTD